MASTARSVARDRLTPAELAAWRGFLRAHAAVIGQLDAELIAAHGLPLSSYDVLVQLERVPGRALRMRDLAAAVLLSRSGLTRLVDRLERDGLVERRECEEDARGQLAVLTAAGAAALRAARPTHLAGVRARFLAALEPGDAERLAAIWDRVEGPEQDLTDSD